MMNNYHIFGYIAQLLIFNNQLTYLYILLAIEKKNKNILLFY